MIPFGEYAPDQAQTDAGFASVAKNVVAGLNSYHPIKSPIAVSEALPNTPQGATYFYRADGSRATVAGDGVGLYELSGAAWTDISNPTAYTATLIDLWEFAQYGQMAIATNGVDPIQKFDIDNDTEFSDLGGSPPKAKYVTVIRDFVVLANTDNSQSEVRWSALNNAENWLIGDESSDTQIMPDAGVIKGISGGENGYIFQDRAITRMTFTSGIQIFQFDKVGSGVGCLSSKSIIQHGSKIFFLGTDGFYLLEKDQLIPIGAERVNKTFFKNVKPTFIDNVHAAIDQKSHVVAWFYSEKTSTLGNLTADKVLFYNWVADKWSEGEIVSTGAVSTLPTAVSLDDSGYDGGSIDTIDYSLDDPSLLGNDPTISVLGDDNRLYVLSGQPLEACIETGPTQPTPGYRTFVSGVTPIIETPDVLCSIGTKERTADMEVFTDENSPEDTGEIPFHTSGRFINIRVRIPYGAQWKNAQGIEPYFKNGGKR